MSVQWSIGNSVSCYITQNHPISSLAHTEWPRISIYRQTPTGGVGQACSEHLALPHFAQNNLALARIENPWTLNFWMYILHSVSLTTLSRSNAFLTLNIVSQYLDFVSHNSTNLVIFINKLRWDFLPYYFAKNRVSSRLCSLGFCSLVGHFDWRPEYTRCNWTHSQGKDQGAKIKTGITSEKK